MPRTVILAAATAAVLMLAALPVRSAERPPQPGPILQTNNAYEKRTVIRKSKIPGAGNGLYASGAIMKGEIIGEMGGRLVSDETYPKDARYIANLPECVWEKMHPYKYIDGNDHGTHVSRINFVPKEINGVSTHLQNAAMRHNCEPPYFTLVALRDIDPGEEILSSYGPDYKYDFMELPQIRNYFCRRLKIDCSKSYTYVP